MEAMRGTIGVSCPGDGGSVFWAEIPLDEPFEMEKSGHPPAPPGREIPASRDPGQAGRIKILCVDSHAFDVQVLESMLEKTSDYALITALQGDLALELAREHRPDLLLIDPELADMSFEEFLSRKQRDPLLQPIPWVVTSAEETASSPRTGGPRAAAYLAKPVSPRSLEEALREGLHPRLNF